VVTKKVMPCPESSKRRSQSWRRATEIYAGGRLVKEQELRLVEHGAAEGEACFHPPESWRRDD